MLKVIWLFVFLLLVGCSTSVKQPHSISHETKKEWAQHSAQLNLMHHWQAQGRLAISRGTKGSTASFVWQQNNDFYHIKLFGPFGAGTVHVVGGPSRVLLRNTNGETQLAHSPEALMKALAGWYVPVTGLQYWLKGLPAPHDTSHAKRFNTQGMLSYLNQEGWHIYYQHYNKDHPFPLPHKLELRNDDIIVKMVITSWKKNLPTH